MGRRGPQPKPTALKILHGNPGRHPINKAEPKYAADAVQPPPGLGFDALQVWHRLAPLLIEQGILNNSHVYTFAGMCSAAAQVMLGEQGIIPASEYYQALDKLIKYSAHFGLTPSSAASIKSPVQEGDELDKWDAENKTA